MSVDDVTLNVRFAYVVREASVLVAAASNRYVPSLRFAVKAGRRSTSHAPGPDWTA